MFFSTSEMIWTPGVRWHSREKNLVKSLSHTHSQIKDYSFSIQNQQWWFLHLTQKFLHLTQYNNNFKIAMLSNRKILPIRHYHHFTPLRPRFNSQLEYLCLRFPTLPADFVCNPITQKISFAQVAFLGFWEIKVSPNLEKWQLFHIWIKWETESGSVVITSKGISLRFFCFT